MSFRSHLHANLSVACLKNISVILSSRFDSGLSRMLVKRSMWLVRLSEDLASLIVAGVYLRHHIFVVHPFVVHPFVVPSLCRTSVFAHLLSCNPFSPQGLCFTTFYGLIYKHLWSSRWFSPTLHNGCTGQALYIIFSIFGGWRSPYSLIAKTTRNSIRSLIRTHLTYCWP